MDTLGIIIIVFKTQYTHSITLRTTQCYTKSIIIIILLLLWLESHNVINVIANNILEL